ncbi:hypothetical protein [uncultured Shewanella sp.]|uniref:hypothetical protein n=1 Tax=uncultured Shewanella sp. TaxID=173975 RepID=UPI00260E7DFA|nr:hypothetical protein [uncultured Shewanella sp.]
MKYLFSSIILLTMLNLNALAAEPTCHSGNPPYCKYIGKVNRIYVNADNLMLLYFDTDLPSEVADSAGYNVSKYSAAAFSVDQNPEFAKMLYSTALAAQASNRDVTIQMRGSTWGYLKIDRIWLDAP